MESMTPCRRRASSRHQLRWRVIRALAIALVMISAIAVTRAIVIPTTSRADSNMVNLSVGSYPVRLSYGGGGVCGKGINAHPTYAGTGQQGDSDERGDMLSGTCGKHSIP